MPPEKSANRHLLELCGGYFFFYVLTGIAVKYFTAIHEPRMSDIAYLYNSTLGGSLFALGVVFLLGWQHIKTNGYLEMGVFQVPEELPYIIPSGICTAVVIPTTTLMYTLPISVMVAMVIMRGSIIIVSRLVDEIQIYQGILKKRVVADENWAVLFALLAVATNLLHPGGGKFDFLQDTTAVVVLGLYIAAYFIRIYIMNYYKNTRSHPAAADNHGFFAIEQISASVTLFLATVFFCVAPPGFGWTDFRFTEFKNAVEGPDTWAILSGVVYGAVAFFSVFIFMYQGKTATFAGLVNRLTSLIAGTVATVIVALFFRLHWPSWTEWLSLGLIGVSVIFLARAEAVRKAEASASGSR